MLRLNNNINDGGSGGGGGTPHSSGNLIKMSGYADNASYIDLAPLDPASLKSINSDIYCSFYLAQDGIENTQDIFYIEKICGIGLSDGQLKSWNWETMSHDTVIESPTAGVRYDLKCEVRNDGENTTRKWYRKISDTWTAIADAEFTDNGVDPDATSGNRLFATVAEGSRAFRGLIDWDAFRIDIGGVTAFNAKTAVRGTDYTVTGLFIKAEPF